MTNPTRNAITKTPETGTVFGKNKMTEIYKKQKPTSKNTKFLTTKTCRNKYSTMAPNIFIND